MNTKKSESTILIALVLLALLALPALPAAADSASFSGEFRLGFRSVSVDGREEKFDQQYNIDDGPRLFDLRLNFVPAEDMRDLADRVQLDFDNYGGDAFETLRLSVQKYGSYDFKYDRRKSNYFYEDIILPPELADVRLSSGGDFHTFHFDRVQDTASLDITLSPAAKLNVGFLRFTREGESTTTLDIQRDEFELDKPIDETMDQYNVGFEYAWDKVTLVLEEEIKDYDNAYEIFLPGFSPGENTTNSAALDFFFLDQPYNFESNQHTARVNVRPNSRLSLRFSGILQTLDLDVEASERSAGTGFNGQPFTTDAQGAGEIQRDTDLFDFDFSYLVTNRVAVVGSLYQKSLDQEGDFLFDGEPGEGRWEIDTSGGEAGLQFSVSPRVTVSGGLRWESRDVKFGAEEGGGSLDLEEETTDHTGYFANVAWRPSKAFNLNLEFEDSSYDDPFALASPTDRQRIRLRGKYDFDNGLYVSGVYLSHDYENSNSNWEATNDQYNLRLGYHNDAVHLGFGYSVVEMDRNVDQLTTVGLFPILYQSDADFIDGWFKWVLSERWKVGGSFYLYENDGSFGLQRDDLRAFIEHTFGKGYLVQVAYRTVDYDENDFNFDDYDASITEFSVGYRW